MSVIGIFQQQSGSGAVSNCTTTNNRGSLPNAMGSGYIRILRMAVVMLILGIHGRSPIR